MADTDYPINGRYNKEFVWAKSTTKGAFQAMEK
jgi:hypothetical protein